jgi:FkbM family methyltransferase
VDGLRGSAPAELGFHGDRHLLTVVAALAGRCQQFLETGTNLGTTLGYVARTFPHLHCLSCEPDPAAAAVARRHVAGRPQVEFFAETSQAFLERLRRRPELHGPTTLAWLDAHGYGFEWPLREELAFLSRRFRGGYLLIDDFEVPGRPEFGFDAYGDHVCNFEYVRSALAPRWRHRLYYPAYREHTSPYHPLRGFGLLQFGPGPLPRLDLEPPFAGLLTLAGDTVPTAAREAVPAPLPRRTAAVAGPAGPMVRRDPYDDLRGLLPEGELTLVDGGAHRGHTVHRLRSRWPRAQIHAVEANPAHSATLAALATADPRLTVHPVALAEVDGERELAITAKDDSSSFFEPSELARGLHGGALAVECRVRVPARRLSSLVQGPIELLKLDLQGAELEVLRGAGAALEQVRAVLVEVEFAALYAGQPLFGEVDALLRARGFELFNLYDLWTSPAGRLTSGDALYLNRRHYDLA